MLNKKKISPNPNPSESRPLDAIGIHTRLSVFVLIGLVLVVLYNIDGLWAGYQPPLVPIHVKVNSKGDVTVSVSASLPTPIGTFDLSPNTSIDSIQKQYRTRLLIVRVDGKATVYELSEGKDFRVSFDDNNTLYRQVSLDYQGSKNCDIIF